LKITGDTMKWSIKFGKKETLFLMQK
jgi:hypothetical protein